MSGDNLRYAYQTPAVLLLTFCRPDHAARVLERIKEAKPSALYIACDGPRPGRADDVANVRAIHELVDRIDWCGNVKTLFRERNLACGRAVSEAISWFLEQSKEGIILEDDCLPDGSFFPFCGEMLDRYRDVSNVMQVSGYNLICDKYHLKTDYAFSNLCWVWGWATWLRAWQSFDPSMSTWPTFKELGCHKRFPFNKVRVDIFDDVHAGRYDTWDYQWQYSIASKSGLAVVPRVNLIWNIGCGLGATHSKDASGDPRFQVLAAPLPFPLKHCEILCPDPEYDRILLRTSSRQSLYGMLRGVLVRAYRRIYPKRASKS